jgi:hypothetical protein
MSRRRAERPELRVQVSAQVIALCRELAGVSTPERP